MADSVVGKQPHIVSVRYFIKISIFGLKRSETLIPLVPESWVPSRAVFCFMKGRRRFCRYKGSNRDIWKGAEKDRRPSVFRASDLLFSEAQIHSCNCFLSPGISFIFYPFLSNQTESSSCYFDHTNVNHYAQYWSVACIERASQWTGHHSFTNVLFWSWSNICKHSDHCESLRGFNPSHVALWFCCHSIPLNHFSGPYLALPTAEHPLCKKQEMVLRHQMPTSFKK